MYAGATSSCTRRCSSAIATARSSAARASAGLSGGARDAPEGRVDDAGDHVVVERGQRRQGLGGHAPGARQIAEPQAGEAHVALELQVPRMSPERSARSREREASASASA